MIITKTCNTCEHYPNDHHCVGCEWDKGKRENTKWELKTNPIVIERAVLDEIRAEIDRQEKWLLQAGYTAYNTDIAFDSIKRVTAESEETDE